MMPLNVLFSHSSYLRIQSFMRFDLFLIKEVRLSSYTLKVQVFSKYMSLFSESQVLSLLINVFRTVTVKLKCKLNSEC